jgi:hypothetical protein
MGKIVWSPESDCDILTPLPSAKAGWPDCDGERERERFSISPTIIDPAN